ncbi:hypothetical protein [Methyloglobulus sp.]|uniref:hypothetical protein n=1 Tax=Methyloglobulus sp. TaxID=2518622 RepID=UPI0032B77EEA
MLNIFQLIKRIPIGYKAIVLAVLAYLYLTFCAYNHFWYVIGSPLMAVPLDTEANTTWKAYRLVATIASSANCKEPYSEGGGYLLLF